MEREEIISKYVENEKEIGRLRKNNKDLLEALAEQFEHKPGEIVKYLKKGRTEPSGYLSSRQTVEVPDKEITAVLYSVKPSISNIFIWGSGEPSVSINLDFKQIKKDGSISRNSVYLNKDEVIWTGEIHKDFKEDKS